MSQVSHLINLHRRRRLDPRPPHPILDRRQAHPALPPAVLRVEFRRVGFPLLQLPQGLGPVPHPPEGLRVLHHLPVGGAVPVLGVHFVVGYVCGGVRISRSVDWLVQGHGKII